MPKITPKRAIRIWLASRDKTQAWLAVRVEMRPSQLSSILAGMEPCPPEVADRLRRETGIDIHASEDELRERVMQAVAS